MLDAPLRIRGARVHNLQSVDLDLPRGRLVALTGRSGSGKSSLAFDTLHVEATRRFAEALAPRQRGAALARPDVDLISGLPPSIALPQDGTPASRRATVATRVEIYDLLRALWARLGVGRCPGCGSALPVSAPEQVAGAILRYPEGTRLTLMAPIARQRVGGVAELLAELSRQGFARARVDGAMTRTDEPPTVDARAAHDVDLVVDRLRVSQTREDRLLEALRVAFLAGRGRVLTQAEPEDGPATLARWADHPWCEACDRALPSPTPGLFSFNTAEGACGRCEGLGQLDDGRTCPDCEGARLGPEARAFEVGGRSLPDVLAAPLPALRRRFQELAVPELLAPLRDELTRRLDALCEIGLGHLTLGRALPTLSSGEQRALALVARTAGEMSGALYVLDEPGAGLGADGHEAVLRLLRRLRDAGNTVLVVTHDGWLIRAADHVVELGPGAGREGGRLIFEGSPADLAHAGTPTGLALQGQPRGGERARRPVTSWLRLRGASGWNLARVDLDVPTRALSALIGPAGSGKTALVEATLGRAVSARLAGGAEPPLPFDALELPSSLHRLARLSRGPVGRSDRSCVATAAGLWGPLRELLAATAEARTRGLGAEFFSFNRPGGRCPACEGAGARAVRLALLPEHHAPCEVCEGRRFTREVLAVRFRGANAADWLDTTVSEARRLLAAQPRLSSLLGALERSGLGYLRLGQSTEALSGGEAQRLRLARELGGGDPRGALFLLDGVSLGLHPLDVAELMEALHALVDAGATVLCADADPAVGSSADAVFHIGPGAGPDGGRLIG